jgi:hypothetical protein
VSIGGAWGGPVYGETGFYSSPVIPPGTYTVEVYNGAPAGVKLGERSGIQVRAGETVMADIDLTSTAGKVVGAIQVNGAGHLAGISVAIPPYGASVGSDSSGNFAGLLPPGTGYTASVGAGCGSLGTFPFDITAGLTTGAGTHDFAAGDLQGTVKWNGTPVSAWAEDFQFAADGLPDLPVSRETGSYSVENCAPGPYTATVFIGWPGHRILQVAGPLPVGISAGGTTTADIDLAPWTGEVTGVIKVGGAPYVAQILVPTGPGVYSWSDSSGNFAILLREGDYMAVVRDPSNGSLLGTFAFHITAGQTVRTLHTSQTIGIGGGIVAADDGSVTITVPADALPEPVTISLTATQDPSFELTVPDHGQAVAVLDVFAEPAGLTFDEDVTIVFAWKDDDKDGIVDGTTIKEDDLFVTKYGVAIPGVRDTGANTFTIIVRSFSEFDLAAPQDTDDDGVPDNFDSVVDNCPLVSNPGQENTDGGPPPSGTGAIGNGTGIAGDDATIPNGDSIGDACDPDIDNDGIPNGTDSDQGGDITYDDNANGDPCVPLGTDGDDDGPSWDSDCNGVRDGMEGSCPLTTNPNGDDDGDGLKNSWEVCKWGTDPTKVETDGDGIGDCIEAVDTDGNGVIDFGSDTLNSARATLLDPAAFGKDGDFDLDGNNVVAGDFGADTLTVARMSLGILPCQ